MILRVVWVRSKSQLSQLESDRQILHEREGTLNEEISTLRAKIDPAEKDLATAEAQERELQAQDGSAQRSMTSADRLYNQVQVDVIRQPGSARFSQKPHPG